MTMCWLFYFLLHYGARWRMATSLCKIMEQWKIVNFTHAQTAETRRSFLHPWMPGMRLAQLHVISTGKYHWLCHCNCFIDLNQSCVHVVVGTLCEVPAVPEKVDIWLAHTDTRYQLSQIRESGHLACTRCNCFIDLKCMLLWIMWGTSCPRESGHLACTQWHKVLAVPEKVDTWLAHTDTQTDTPTPITTAHLQLSCIIKRATEFLVETAPKSHVAERYVWGMHKKCTMYQAVTCDKHWKSSADYTAVIVRLLVATLHIMGSR